MVKSTNCIIILVPIPSLPKPLFLTVLISCKHSCRLSCTKYRLPNEKTNNPLRKPSPHKTPRETASHAEQYYTAAIQNATFEANHIHRSVICSSHSQILPLPHFYIPQNVNPHNKTPPLKKFSPIPSLPKPLFLTSLINCKHSCRFSPLRNTGYPVRKVTIHFGNRPHIKRQGKLLLTQHNSTPLLYKTQLSKQITFTEA